MIPSVTAPAPLNTAVLFLVFNRPHTTSRVFDAISRAKPARLYVAADGPRKGCEGERERVYQVRDIATSVNWPCEVKTLFREENLGCKSAVSEAITWFFSHEEQGIILEDDCLPGIDFFIFCETLLNKYAKDDRVSVITGNNFQNGQSRGAASYYFSKYPHCWGWATWRRAWQHYQGDLPWWPEWSRSDEWHGKASDAVERRYWCKVFDSVCAGAIDSWAYPWTCSVWYRGGLTATPNVNLVSNIGFGPGSTHTDSINSPLSNLATREIGNLLHPSDVIQDKDADRHAFDTVFGGRFLRFPHSLFHWPRRALGFAYRFLKRIYECR